MDKPLKSVRVIDLTIMPPWEFVTYLLAELGAEVIKVEPPSGTPTRNIPPKVNGVSLIHMWVNKGKRCMMLNLKKEQGQEVLERLVKLSDVLVESYSSETAERLGITYERMKKLNPKIIHCSITAFGRRVNKTGHDLNIIAETGALSLIKDEEGRPVIPGLLISDFGTAYLAFAQIMTALFRRLRYDDGCYIDVSMASSVIPFLLPALADTIVKGVQPSAKTFHLMGLYPTYNVYSTADGRYIAVGIAVEHHLWKNFCERLGITELIDHQFNPEKVKELANIFIKRNLDEWIRELNGIECVSPVYDLVEIVKKIIEILYNSSLFRNLINTPNQSSLEYKTDEILAELGFSLEEIEKMKYNGVIN